MVYNPKSGSYYRNIVNSYLKSTTQWGLIIYEVEFNKRSSLFFVYENTSLRIHKYFGPIVHNAWWLSSVKFKYKPGYRPCDLL